MADGARTVESAELMSDSFPSVVGLMFFKSAVALPPAHWMLAVNACHMSLSRWLSRCADQGHGVASS
jgi:hypothetical protein